MVNEMLQLVRKEDDFDPITVYDIYKDLFSMKVHYGGSFNPKVGREYILEVRFYHFIIPGINLDYCLVALGSDKEVKEIVIHVTRNKVIDLYIEHDTTTLNTYFNERKDGVITDELDDNMPPSPTNSEGFTKLCLQTPFTSKTLTIDIYKDLFSMKVHYGGSFNPKVGREYILEVRFYHFMIPGINLDYCLVALGSDKEVKEIVIHVTRNELDDNMPPSPTNNEGFTKLYLQTPSSSKHLTISEAIQLKYEERERKRLIPIEGPFNSRPGVIYLGNLPLLRPCEIPWIDREDCGDDIGCSSSKGKEQEVEANGNEAYYFDPFEDLDDILRQYAKDNRVEAHKAKLGEVEKEVDTEIDSDDDTEDEGDNHIEFGVSNDSDGFVMLGLLR
ncbi:hypothetical protein Tco_0117150 [Tanacetum coccineum]